MNSSPRLTLGLLALALPLGVIAQVQPATPSQPGSPARTSPSAPAPAADGRLNDYGETGARRDTSRRYEAGASADYVGARAGDREFTLGGNGVSNKDLDNSAGGVSASYGYYFSDQLEGVIRQTVNYTNPDDGDTGWAGSTRAALDFHFATTGALRPFVGVNFGGVYGEDTNDTLVAGVEGGLKFYVQPRTFIYALVDYGWSFKDTDDAEDNFDDGGFTWSLGIGFNF